MEIDWKSKYEELEIHRADCCMRMEKERKQLYAALNELMISATVYEGEKDARLYIEVERFNLIRKLLIDLKGKV